MPVVIYRLGSIGANTETGACNPNDINTLFINIQHDTYGNIYHIVNNNGRISFQNVLDSIRSCDIQIEGISYDEWQNKLIEESKQNDQLKSIAEFFLHYNPFKQKSLLSIEKDSNKASQFAFSPLDNSYIVKWLLFILNNIIVSS